MTTDYSIRGGMVETCVDALQSLDTRGVVDAAAFVELFPDNGRVLEVPIAALPDDIVADWRQFPGLVTAHFRAALPELASDPDGDIPQQAASEATVRLTGYDDAWLYDVGLYRPEEVVDSVVHLRGQVTTRSSRRLRDEVIAFECTRCGWQIEIPQSGDSVTEPGECESCGRGGPFGVNEAETEVRDYQNIELQTLAEHAPDGETSTIALRLFDDHVGSVAPGDRVVVTVDIEGIRVSQDSRVRKLGGDVLDVTHLETDYSDVEVEPYRDEIETIAAGEHDEYDCPHDAIVDSIAPGHTGDEHIKLAIGYQLFGGVEKDLPDGTWMRGNSHILLMGDPGTGKTSIIEYVTDLVPRSEYGTGKGSTSAGLTATVQKDDFEGGDGWSLQAGLLVKANNGLAAIDELDKMNPDDRDGMMEAMSQQRVTVSMVKSGTMPAKTAVLAAANPKYGTFDPYEEIGTQLDLDPVLLSRFDLWFVMRDEVDEEQDREIADDVLGQARAGERLAAGKDPDTATGWEEPPIPPAMFRAYVSLAKDCVPELTSDAMARIRDEYVEIRQSNDEDGPVPTTARTVTGLTRLAEASARMRLGDHVTEADVERAVEMLTTSLELLGVDPETGELDAARMETGVGKSKRERRKGLKAIIRAKQSRDEPADADAVREAALEVMDEDAFEHELDKMTQQGDVYRPGGPGTLKTTD